VSISGIQTLPHQIEAIYGREIKAISHYEIDGKEIERFEE